LKKERIERLEMAEVNVKKEQKKFEKKKKSR